ncbi:hypothetical protein [Pseudanabaena sp. PCC 6802]|uniref:hypothetical protein n=1 Tax=Pseudanabaena sp. PCC 6802 TaxID=118173 RepID=UPI0012EAF3E8|nr:hypothetical protein [Pseudanabaena sp. PCC 6802]
MATVPNPYPHPLPGGQCPVDYDYSFTVIKHPLSDNGNIPNNYSEEVKWVQPGLRGPFMHWGWVAFNWLGVNRDQGIIVAIGKGDDIPVAPLGGLRAEITLGIWTAGAVVYAQHGRELMG